MQWVVDELLRGEVGAMQVATGYVVATHAQLARLARLNLAQILVEDEGAVAHHRTPDSHWPVSMDAASRDSDGTLRRAVGILEPATGGPQFDEVIRQRFAADVDEAQIGKLPRWGLALAHAQERWSRADNRDPLAPQEGHEIGPEPHHVVAHGDECRSGGEGEVSLLDRRVKGVRGTLPHPVLWPDVEVGEVREHQVHDVPVLDHYPLGLSGRA